MCQTAVGGTHEVVEVRGYHSYTHIMGKVRVKEWECIQTLWCKGHGRVKSGSTQPPDPGALWCCSLQDMGPQGGASVCCGPETGPLPQSQRDLGTCFCPQRKCTWLWVGPGGRSHTGSMGREGWDQNKQITFSETRSVKQEHYHILSHTI